jgi:hypothetical protein
VSQTTNSETILKLRKLLGIKSKIDARLLDAGEWVTNGFILLKKSLEPRRWKRRRYNGTLDQEKVDKIVAKFNQSTVYESLSVDTKIDLRWPSDIALIGENNKTYVDVEFLTLLSDIYLHEKMRFVKFQELEFVQESHSPLKETYSASLCQRKTTRLNKPVR